MHYVYMLESLVDGDYYKGSSDDYKRRFEEHNQGECQFTRTKCPWKLIFVQTFETKGEALIREKQLKKM